MEKMKMQTPDLSQENIRKIAEFFPNCVTEAENNLHESAPPADQNIRLKVDFDLLRQELSADVVEGPAERYSLNWPGKRAAIATANAPINKTLPNLPITGNAVTAPIPAATPLITLIVFMRYLLSVNDPHVRRKTYHRERNK